MAEETDNKEKMMTEMAQAGLHIGRQRAKGHPKMKPYVCAVREGFQIIDLSRTIDDLETSLNFISGLIKKGGKFLFVGTIPAAKEIIGEAAKAAEMPYVNRRWIGGTLTNFNVISGRLNHCKDLMKKKAAGELGKYTKKEQLQFEREIFRMQERFGGILGLEKIPDAIFVVNPKLEEIAVREARRMKLPIVAMVNTDADPALVDYPIPANNNAVSAIKYVADRIVETIKKAKTALTE